MTNYNVRLYMKYPIILIIVLFLFMPLVSAQGEFLFDFAAKAQTDNSYIKHWSSTYPPDQSAEIIIYTSAINMNYKRLSALGFIYVVYDPMNNIVAVEKITSFKRSYDPNIIYYTLHPKTDWVEGNYKVNIIVFDMVDREAFDEKVTNDPFAIGIDPEKYKIFYDTGANAKELGVLKDLGEPAARAVLNFKIDKNASLYPPDRFLLHDVRFVDDSNERILGEKIRIEVKIDNNYKDDGELKIGMLIDNNLVSTKDVTIKGLNTSTVIFDAKAGKIGTFNLRFGSDNNDVKYRDAELTFTIKNETESTRLPELPQIKITGMNVNKEFIGIEENVTVSINAINNGKTGNKSVTVYSNNVPLGSKEIHLEYLEEKTVQITVNLRTTGLNKITISGAPQLYRNVFVQEEEAGLKNNPIIDRIKGNSLKVSILVVCLIFAGILYRVRNKLKDETIVIAPSQGIRNELAKSRFSEIKDNLASKVNELIHKMKNILKKKPPT